MKNGHLVGRAAALVRAIAYSECAKIVNYIGWHEPVHVKKIYKSLGLEQSETSQRLAILRRAMLVTARRNGKKIFYTVNYDQVEKIAAATLNFKANELMSKECQQNKNTNATR